MKKQQTTIVAISESGRFAEDKDRARSIRIHTILPALERHDRVVLDFEDVDLASQSFVHALISEAIRSRGEAALELIEFKSCNRAVKAIILTVIEYSLDSMTSSPPGR